MKCGVGKCGRCNCGAVYVCKEGPVFTLEDLKLPRTTEQFCGLPRLNERNHSSTTAEFSLRLSIWWERITTHQVTDLPND